MSKKLKNKIFEEQEDFDQYTIREDWNTLKSLVEIIELDLEKFLKKREKNASIRVRNNLANIKTLSIRIREGILFQRKDNHREFF